MGSIKRRIRSLLMPSDPTAASMKGVNAYWRKMTPADIERGGHRAFIGGHWDDVGQLQLDFLVREGMQPQDALLDVGCGALRGGVRFVQFLDHGRYHGYDINASLIEAGRRELEAAGVGDRGAHLLVEPAFDATRFGQTFRWAIAVSVLTHLPRPLLEKCLTETARVLEPGGRFYASVFEAPTPGHRAPLPWPEGITSFPDKDPFHYHSSELADAATAAGLTLRWIREWEHPRGQRMALFER